MIFLSKAAYGPLVTVKSGQNSLLASFGLFEIPSSSCHSGLGYTRIPGKLAVLDGNFHDFSGNYLFMTTDLARFWPDPTCFLRDPGMVRFWDLLVLVFYSELWPFLVTSVGAKCRFS